MKLVKINGDEIIVSLEGACSYCPSAVATFRAGIRNTLKAHLDWVKDVKPDREPEEPKFNFRLASWEEVKKQQTS